MPQHLEVYKCLTCGNIVEILTAGIGELVCCEKPMMLLTENTIDAPIEKHIPVIEKSDTGYTVTVGSTPHPMEEDHYIEWIELLANVKAYRQFLSPGDKPQASFAVDAAEVTAREHCNLHGIWKS